MRGKSTRGKKFDFGTEVYFSGELVSQVHYINK